MSAPGFDPSTLGVARRLGAGLLGVVAIAFATVAFIIPGLAVEALARLCRPRPPCGPGCRWCATEDGR